jgi:hypothetical protein
VDGDEDHDLAEGALVQVEHDLRLVLGRREEDS